MLKLRPATDIDLTPARELTCRGMLPYYLHYDLLWQDEAFDVAWAGRQHWIIERAGEWLGFVSLSRDPRALYIRELHVSEAVRSQGVGSQIIAEIFRMAEEERRPAVRLTVFKTNPAQGLYLRQGFVVAGEDECFVRMERPCPAQPATH